MKDVFFAIARELFDVLCLASAAMVALLILAASIGHGGWRGPVLVVWAFMACRGFWIYYQIQKDDE